MRRLAVFENLTPNGYFADTNGQMDWAHAGSDDLEFAAFVSNNAGGGGELLFGRVTYDLMASFWPTPAAAQAMPDVARAMNARVKYVASRTMKNPAWENTKLLKGDLLDAVRALKSSPGPDIVILGSGSIAEQLAQAGLIDQFQFVINPLLLGKGKTMFGNIATPRPLKLMRTRAFANGKVFLVYEAA